MLCTTLSHSGPQPSPTEHKTMFLNKSVLRPRHITQHTLQYLA